MFVSMGVSNMNIGDAEKIASYFRILGFEVKSRVQGHTRDSYLVDVTYENSEQKATILFHVDKYNFDYCFGVGLENEHNVIISRHINLYKNPALPEEIYY
jgi:hypothetical protein